jgi:hypothetical protein
MKLDEQKTKVNSKLGKTTRAPTRLALGATRDRHEAGGPPPVEQLPNGRVEGIVEASDEVGPDTVAFAFGWGNAADPRPVREKGSNVQALTSADRRCDPVTGLALQSAIPVNVRRVEPSVDVDASLALAHSSGSRISTSGKR